jgi:prevent-host-death family protein
MGRIDYSGFISYYTHMKSQTKAKPRVVKATEAKNRFGEVLDAARIEPVTIEKNGRPVAVLISSELFERLEALEDAWWAAEAKKAMEEGSLGTEASEAFLLEMLNKKS